MNNELLFKEEAKRIIKCFYDVYNTLGYGFLEKVYENAMLIELSNAGFSVEKQKPINVYYDGKKIGEYFADIIVNGCIFLELKAAEYLAEEHEYQLINYLKATDIELGILLNFGKEPQFKRKVFSKNKIIREN